MTNFVRHTKRAHTLQNGLHLQNKQINFPVPGSVSDKSCKSFPSCYSQSPPQLWRQISISSNSRNLLQFLQFSDCKPDRKPYPLPYGLINPNRNLKSENSQYNTRKPQRNCTFMKSALVYVRCTFCRILNLLPHTAFENWKALSAKYIQYINKIQPS
jgi:hypothetical protein